MDAGFPEWPTQPNPGDVMWRLGVEVERTLAMAGGSPPVRRPERFGRYTLAT